MWLLRIQGRAVQARACLACQGQQLMPALPARLPRSCNCRADGLSCTALPMDRATTPIASSTQFVHYTHLRLAGLVASPRGNKLLDQAHQQHTRRNAEAGPIAARGGRFVPPPSPLSRGALIGQWAQAHVGCSSPAGKSVRAGPPCALFLGGHQVSASMCHMKGSQFTQTRAKDPDGVPAWRATGRRTLKRSTTEIYGEAARSGRILGHA